MYVTCMYVTSFAVLITEPARAHDNWAKRFSISDNKIIIIIIIIIINNGARPTSLRAKKHIFARMTAGVCSITAGSAAIFRDRPAFAGHRNLFLIQRFSNGRISDLRNMTCTNFRCPNYARSGRRRTPDRTPGGARPSVARVSGGRRQLLITDRNSEGARPYIDRASHDSR